MSANGTIENKDKKIDESALKRAQAKLRKNKLNGGFGTIESAHSVSSARSSMRISFDEVSQVAKEVLPSFSLGDYNADDSIIDALHNFLVTRNDHDAQNIKLYYNVCGNVLHRMKKYDPKTNSSTSNNGEMKVFADNEGRVLDLLLNSTYRRSTPFKKVVVEVSELGNLLDFCGAIAGDMRGDNYYAFFEEENIKTIRTSLLKYYSAMKQALVEDDKDFWRLPVEWQIDFGS